jgi:hypothetical protein
MTDQPSETPVVQVVPEGIKPTLLHLGNIYRAARAVNATADQHDQLKNSLLLVEKQILDSYTEPEKESDTADGSEHEEQQV